MAIKDLEWFEIHLEHIDNTDQFEEAMELAHVKGFEDGFESGEEEGYNSGIYSSVVEEKIKNAIKEERDHIIRLLSTNLGHVDFDDLVAMIEDDNDAVDDYFDTQLSKGSVREKPYWAERITRSRARFYQEGMAHGAELERDRIIKILDKNLGRLDWDDLVKLIRQEDLDD